MINKRLPETVAVFKKQAIIVTHHFVQVKEKEGIYNVYIGEENFHRLYVTFYPSLTLLAVKIVGDEKIAEDLVQDVFTRTWEARKSKALIENVSVYFYRAVKYRCLNELRNQKSHRQIAEEVLKEDDVHFEHLYIQQETIRRIHEMIAQLPPKCREIFLKHIDGQSNKEIAEELGIAEETVKKQKQIARKFIREKGGDLLLLLFLSR